MGALYHPPGGIIRHDAVVWGLRARRRPRRRRDPPLHRGRPGSSARTAASRRADQPGRRSRRGHRGQLHRRLVSSRSASMAGVQLPITTHILQAFVTEPLKPLLDVVIVSSQMHVYISARPTAASSLIGAEIEPWTTYRQHGTLNFLQEASRTPWSSSRSSSGRGCCAAGPASATSAPTTARSSAPPRSRTSSSQRGLGHLRLQGGADRRQDARRAGRHRPHARADRAVRARALLPRPPRLRARRRRGLSH